jgi:uncharacterized protein YdhG (YjbR/CyaY superfamily)
MQSRATDVSAYLEEIPETRRPTLNRLRDLCRKCLVGYEEGMAYGMPTYSKDGKPEVSFASQKNYISLYVMKSAVVEAYLPELAVASVGKGCIRYSKPEKIDFAVIEKLLVATRESSEAAC